MSELHLSYSRARLDDRQVTELIGIARGVMADGLLANDEILFLERWLAATSGVLNNPVLTSLKLRIDDVLADGIVDEDERAELAETLHSLCRNDFELGEATKSTSLPLCAQPPDLDFLDRRFPFTGTFAFGSRKECESAVTRLGANAGSLTKKTNFLVIGEYATESWVHATFGRKIEKAVEMRDAGTGIAIVSEAHWRSSI